MSMFDNKLLNTLADPVITKNFEMGDNGNGEIRLSNNTIDNKGDDCWGCLSSFSNKTWTKACQ